jgi:hypothetical protein
MRTLLYLLFTVFILSGFQSPEVAFPPKITSNNSLAPGEKLTYKVHYGWIEAGEVVMQIDRNLHAVNGKSCYKIDVGGESKGALYLFLKMRNYFGSYLDTTNLIPQRFYRNIQEGTYRKNEKIEFDHIRKLVIVEELNEAETQVIRKDEYGICDNVQDMVSTWYVLRNLDFNTVQVGDILYSPVFFDNILYEKFKTKFLGRKIIKTKLGPMNTLVLTPLVPFTSTGKSIFAGENSVELYLSDDQNKIPVKIKIKLLVGAVEMDLINYEGLKHPVAIKKQKKPK